jgi:hypothetical protein
MSRLVDKLNKTNKSITQPMGFRTSRSEGEESSLVIIASADSSTFDVIKEYTAGADAVCLIKGGSAISAKSIQPIVKALSGIPCGISIEDTGSKKLDEFIRAGCDFLLFTAESPVESIPQDEKTGKLLRVDPSLEDSLARVINNLPVDAVITTEVTDKGKAITWQHLMNIQRLATLITKPVIIPVPPNISHGELRAVRDADIDGIMVAADPGESGRIERIRRGIRELPPRLVKKRGKSDALLPRSTNPTESAVPEEDDDDDDY